MSCIYKYKGKDYIKDEFYSLVRTTMVQPRTVQKIVPNDTLKTFDFGSLEGTPQTKEKNNQIHNNIINSPEKFMADEGESFNDAYNRVVSTIKDIIATSPSNTVVLTHNSVFGLIKLWDKEERPLEFNKEQRIKYTKQDNTFHPGDRFTIEGINGPITIIRHGETQDNVNGNFRSSNTQLTDKGIQQAETLGRELKNTPISQIISSPLERTIDTANIILNNQERKEEKKDVEVSPKTISLLKDFIKSIGVDIQQVTSINGRKNVNGSALLMQHIIQIIEGKEVSALPEETMHFVVAIIKQKNPSLYNKLLKEINNYTILNETFQLYKDEYIKREKPDVIRIKEEAIGKLLAEILINKSQDIQESPQKIEKVNNWWREIIEFLKGLFSKSGFDQLTMNILSGKNIGTAQDIKDEQNMYQLNPQEKIIVDLKSTSNKIEKREDGYYIEGVKVPFRVSDEVHSWYSRRFDNKELTFNEYEKSLNTLKAEKGTEGHSAIEYAFSRMVDEDGNIRKVYLDEDDYELRNPKFSKEFYSLLKTNLEQRLLSYKEGTKFLAEITIYNAKLRKAGTIDFLAIEPDGKTNILDWKFINLNIDKYTDIPWYKIGAWNLQMDQYKGILVNAYNIKSIGQSRMIPIQAKYTKGNIKENILPLLSEIKIGDVNVKNITDDILLPVGIQTEKIHVESLSSANNKKLNNLLEKLNIMYKKLSEKKVSEEDRLYKKEQLNSLFKAIRHLQIKQDLSSVLYQSKLLNQQAERLISLYDKRFKAHENDKFSDEEKNDFSKNLNDIIINLELFKDLDTNLRSLFVLDTSEEAIKLKEDLRRTSENARDHFSTLDDLRDEYNEKIIVKSVGITDFLKPEKVIKDFLTKWFSTTSTLQTKAINFLYKKAFENNSKVAMDTMEELKQLTDISSAYDTWFKSKGISKNNYFDFIKKKNSNELINEFDHEFYIQLKQKIKDRDTIWIKENIDVEKLQEKYTQQLEKEINSLLDRNEIYTLEEIDAINTYRETREETNHFPYKLKQEINKLTLLYNLSSLDSFGWLLKEFVQKFPSSKWESKEWVELNKKENKPAKDFYDYIVKKNNEYAQFGYITKQEARVFLPYVRAGLTERLFTGKSIKLGEQFLHDISVDQSDTGYGQLDPLTGKPLNIIPKYFTQDTGKSLSVDLFKTMALYNEAAIRYKYLSNIKDMIKGVLATERNKKSISTSIFGKTVYKDGEVELTNNNEENSKIFEDMMKAIIYRQKFITSDTFDQVLFKIGNWGNTINKKLGVNIFPEDLSERQLSVNKVVSALNTSFQLSTLGLNITSGASNFFGGNTHSLINAGIYFTKSDYLAAEGTIIINKFNGADKKKMIGALEYFLPFTEDYNKEIIKSLSINTLTQESLQDVLMVFMKHSDWNVQSANFYAYLNNTIVLDDKLVNVREYLRTTPKYEFRYKGSLEERNKLKEDFEKDVKVLVNTKGVLKLATIENGRFTIPGVDRKSDSVIELRRKVQQISKNALGNLSEDDLRLINLQVFGKSFMVFKNWIPRLIDIRMGNLKYNSASDAYEWGRTRMIFRMLSEGLMTGIGGLYNSIVANDKGIDYLRDLYEKKKLDYENETGKTLEITEEDFIDLARNNIKSQIMDVVFLLSLTSLIVTLKAIPPDKDEDPAIKNQYKFMLRTIDKFRDELMYFYDPTSLSGLTKNIFPSLTYIENFSKGWKNFMIENWAIATGNEKLEKSNQVIKYWMKTFPFTNQIVGYLPMFYPQMAKDMGLKIQSNYGIR